MCFVNKKHEPLLNLLLLLASSHTFACMVTRLRIRKWLSKGSPHSPCFLLKSKIFERGKIFRLCKLCGNAWHHSYWSKQITCFDNVVDRWHYRQYFSFPPRKTVKNLASPGMGGPTLGTRTIYSFLHTKLVLLSVQMTFLVWNETLWMSVKQFTTRNVSILGWNGRDTG